MMYIITTVRDRLTGCKGLVLELNEDAAKRSFTQAMQNKDSLVYANKDDFELLYLGNYFPDTGTIVLAANSKVLLKGSDIGEVPNKV